jgi:hypothetical protein
MSGVEPAPNGTTILTGLVGQSCAAAGNVSKTPRSAKQRRRFIQFLF